MTIYEAIPLPMPQPDNTSTLIWEPETRHLTASQHTRSWRISQIVFVQPNVVFVTKVLQLKVFGVHVFLLCFLGVLFKL